jgi:hypothetical protein
MAYGLFCVLNVVMAFFAVRVFLGKPLFVLLSFQLLSELFYGQMSGILSGGIALCWWGLAHKRWNIAGLGIILAMMKYQVGLLWCLVMIWYAVVSWRDFSRILLIPAVVFAISMAMYPEWIVRVASNVSTFPYVHLGITFWNYVGAWALLLWIPALFLPLNRKERFFALITAGILSVPYYQHFDLLTLAALPIGWLPLLLQVAFLRGVWEVPAIRLTALLPGLIYAVIVLPAGYHAVKTWVEASIRSRKSQNISES